MNLTIEQTKQLVEKYPYLIPHNSWTGKVIEDYDYSYTEAWGIPVSWHRLFYLLCKQLRPHLDEAKLVDSFYFTQVKEKYGRMCVYTSCLPQSCGRLIDIYEAYSKYICQECGNPTSYCTNGWIMFLCEDCIKEDKDTASRLKRANTVMFKCYTKRDGWHTLHYSYRPVRTEYNKIQKMTDKEFFNYLMED